MDTNEKCAAIIRKMVDLANEDKPVTISEDWKSKFGCTVEVAGEGHTHVGLWDEPSNSPPIEGMPKPSFEILVDGIYNALHGGPGLSFVPDEA